MGLIDTGKRRRDRDESRSSEDVDAYDLILKDKERLLSFDEPYAVHLLALGPARRVGQSECVRHVHAEAQRQHDLAAAGSGPRPAAVRQPARRPHGPPGHGARHQRADGGGQRELQGLCCRLCRRRSASRCPRARSQANEEYLHRQDAARPTLATSQITPAHWPSRSTRYLLKNDYTDDADHVAAAYHEAKSAGTLAALPRGTAALCRAGLPADRQRVQRRAAAASSTTTASPRRIRSTTTSRRRSSRSCGPHQPQGRLQR